MHQDTHTLFYRSIKKLLIIVVIGLFVKFGVFDLFKISGQQMAPTVINGDRVLIFRTPYLPVIRNLLTPGFNKPVLFHFPFQDLNYGLLRVAGRSGDTVSIDSGLFINTANSSLKLPHENKSDVVVPNEYSPRDNFQPLRIPAPGDSFSLDNLSLRDFFFIYSIIKQENRNTETEMKVSLRIDDSISNDYIIKGFSLYKGSIDSVPQKYHDDWFFWARLEDYIHDFLEDKDVSLKFSLYTKGTRLERYTVKKSYVFLLADNWNNGLDSRYFGPVKDSYIVGRAFSVLFSHGKKDEEPASFRIRRFGKIVS